MKKKPQKLVMLAEHSHDKRVVNLVVTVTDDSGEFHTLTRRLLSDDFKLMLTQFGDELLAKNIG